LVSPALPISAGYTIHILSILPDCDATATKSPHVKSNRVWVCTRTMHARAMHARARVHA